MPKFTFLLYIEPPFNLTTDIWYIIYHLLPFWLAGYHWIPFETIGYHLVPLGAIFIARVRFDKFQVCQEADGDSVTELVSDIMVTGDTYTSINTILWLLDNVSALGERGSFDVHLIGKSTFFVCVRV